MVHACLLFICRYFILLMVCGAIDMYYRYLISSEFNFFVYWALVVAITLFLVVIQTCLRIRFLWELFHRYSWWFSVHLYLAICLFLLVIESYLRFWFFWELLHRCMGVAGVLIFIRGWFYFLVVLCLSILLWQYSSSFYCIMEWMEMFLVIF